MKKGRLRLILILLFLPFAIYLNSCSVMRTKTVQSVSLDMQTVSMLEGDAQSVTAVVGPADAANKAVTWSTDNAAVASVDASGKVTAVGEGSANITVTTDDGHFTARCSVDVTALKLELIGSNPASVAIGSVTYPDPGAVSNNNELTSLIKVTGTVDTHAKKSYTLTYNLTNGQKTVTVERIVNVVAQLHPENIPQFVSELLIPWAMPKTASDDPNVDYYEIAMRQFEQQILPEGMPKTTVWGYGSATAPNAVFNAPSLTIEAKANRPVRIKWINQLVDNNGNYQPHLLPIDQTLHWANPTGGSAMRDMETMDPTPYTGPVPIVTHVHGAHTYQESDGFPESWFLPDADNIPDGIATVGSAYDAYKATALSGALWEPGSAVFDYPNDQSAATLWYHDHALGMTRSNVYTGPAGFYLIRGGASDQVFTDAERTKAAVLPGTAPDGTVYDIPIAIQDRTFNEDGSLFYPDSRTYFDGFEGPYIPSSDIAPMWNPEFFGNTIIANGKTWPSLNVEQKQYRFRLLNGCQSRTLILKLSDGSSFWQIGAEQGFLEQPVELTELLLGPAERADVIIDFSKLQVGTKIILQNIGPDEPYGGGVPGVDFEPAKEETTGKVMQFTVIAANGPDVSTPANQLVLPELNKLGDPDNIRQVSLNEEGSAVLSDVGPGHAILGTVAVDPKTGVLVGVPLSWSSPVTENITLDNTEIWEIFNFTEDAHPVHLHLVSFEVIERQAYDPETGELGPIIPAQLWETGFKDTVLSYPGQILRIKARFDKAGTYVWHCHIIEHEDNEMMRPFFVKPET